MKNARRGDGNALVLPLLTKNFLFLDPFAEVAGKQNFAQALFGGRDSVALELQWVVLSWDLNRRGGMGTSAVIGARKKFVLCQGWILTGFAEERPQAVLVYESTKRKGLSDDPC